MDIVAASSAGWVDDAVSGLDAGAVYVSSDVAGAGALQDALASVVPSDGSIGVVVLPSEAAIGTPYATYLLDKITGASHYDTIVIAIGSDVQAASVAIDGDEAMRIANQAESAAGDDLQTALTETVQQIDAEAPAASGDPGLAWLVPVTIGGVVVIAGAGTAWGLLTRRARRTRTASTKLPAVIRARVERLRALRLDYGRLQGDRVAAETAAKIDSLVSHVDQLFTRLGTKAGQDQRASAETEYADKLARLVAALDRDYLLDLLTHPELWDDPAERIGEVREALDAVSTQILDNIKQVNARRALLFQVSLDSLIGRAELRDWEREFKRTAEG